MGLKVYLDSCIVIYLVEEHPAFAPLIEKHLAQKIVTANVTFQVSALTEMECQVMPLRKHNQPLLDKYHNWFSQIERLPAVREVFQHAAQLRATYTGLKTPDALHLAMALEHGCDEFWTNDNRLNQVAPAMVKDIVAIASNS